MKNAIFVGATDAECLSWDFQENHYTRIGEK